MKNYEFEYPLKVCTHSCILHIKYSEITNTNKLNRIILSILMNRSLFRAVKQNLLGLIKLYKFRLLKAEFVQLVFHFQKNGVTCIPFIRSYRCSA